MEGMPTKPGFYWYRSNFPALQQGETHLWCVKVEIEHGQLRGWVPYMDYSDPIEPEQWRGEWLGEAIPPKTEDNTK